MFEIFNLVALILLALICALQFYRVTLLEDDIKELQYKLWLQRMPRASVHLFNGLPVHQVSEEQRRRFAEDEGYGD